MNSRLAVLERVTLLMHEGEFKEAQNILRREIHLSPDPSSIPFRHLLAEVFRSQGDFVNEAATYHDIVKISPNDIAAVRERSFATLRMGSPDLAADYALERLDAFSGEEVRKIQQAKVGRHIKWGEIEANHGIGLRRFDATDRAIEESADIQAAYENTAVKDSPSALRVEYDHLVALRNRVRMKETIARYQALKERKVNIPSYVLAAVADAYLNQKQPNRARDLYRLAIKLRSQQSQRPEREWQFGLLQTYIDTYQFDDARRLAVQLESDIPPALNQGIHGVEVDNDFYERIRVDSVRVRLYADQLKESETMLREILAEAPFSIEARLAFGELKLIRGQAREAQAKFSSILVDKPANLYATLGVTETAMALGDYATARLHLGQLSTHYPGNSSVQRSRDNLKASLRPRLTVESGVGNSTGEVGNRGNRDWRVDAILDSGPIYDNYSLFLRTFNASGDFGDAVPTRRRLGAGVKYRIPSWQLSVELDHNQTKFSQPGLGVKTTWFANDHWQLNGAYEINSNRIPLQAHDIGVKAKALASGLRFSHNESRNLSLDVSYLWFNNKNRRGGIGADWFERWISGPVYKLDTRVAVSASRNSRSNVDYFNPRHDFSLDLPIGNEWALWRHNQRSFIHRVMLGLGAYWQEGFGMKETAIVRYEHRWNIDTLRSFNYGVDYSRHPFDGIFNKRVGFFLNLNWHF